jgi:hypothetical protein
VFYAEMCYNSLSERPCEKCISFSPENFNDKCALTTSPRINQVKSGHLWEILILSDWETEPVAM